MKRIFSSFSILILLLVSIFSFADSAQADNVIPDWNLYSSNAYTIEYSCAVGASCSAGGPWDHSMSITSMDPITGIFSGHGYYISDPNQNWTLSGVEQGSNLSFVITYSNGYKSYSTGTVGSDGVWNGTAYDTIGNQLNFTTTQTQDVKFVPNWNLGFIQTLAYTCTGGCSGTYYHTMILDGENQDTGYFTAHGYYNGDSSITWHMTGRQWADQLVATVTYDNSSYTANINGSAITSDGISAYILGSAADNGGNHFNVQWGGFIPGYPTYWASHY